MEALDPENRYADFLEQYRGAWLISGRPSAARCQELWVDVLCQHLDNDPQHPPESLEALWLFFTHHVHRNDVPLTWYGNRALLDVFRAEREANNEAYEVDAILSMCRFYSTNLRQHLTPDDTSDGTQE